MKVHILTLFPNMFTGPFSESIVKRGVDKGRIEIKLYDLRDYSTDNYRTVDDHPYGGGPGMVMRVDIIDKAVSNIKSEIGTKTNKVVLLDAGGEKFSQKKALELTRCEELILICGHYEGVDHRIHEYIADEIISIGDYVLSGGELPAMVMVDSMVRLLPGVVGNAESLIEESHDGLGNEYPQYTRPEEYKGWKVPDILLNGNHKLIKEWRDQNRPLVGNKLLTD